MTETDPAAGASAEAVFRAALAAHRRGDLVAAERGYRQVLAAAAHAPSLNNLGMILQARGRLDEATAAFRAALELAPEYADACNNLAGALHAAGDLPGAETACRRALAGAPAHPQAHNNLGLILDALGRHADALEAYRVAVRTTPANLEARHNLALALRRAGHDDEAIDAFLEVLAARPDAVEVWCNLGQALRAAGRHDEALEAYRSALQQAPGDAHALHGLANAEAELGQLDAARESYRRAIAADPALADAHYNLGNLLHRRVRIREAIESYKRALELRPQFAEAHSNLLLCLHYVDGIEPQAIAAEHHRWSELHESPLRAAQSLHNNTPEPERRLRIGYVSADFRAHPVGQFIEPVIAAHDRAGFEVYCYSNAPNEDAVTARLRAAADVWRDIQREGDAAVVQRVHDDRIDLLIDLAGHSGEQRLAIFARRPAPVQLTWLGYPDTTGLKAMDYRLTDALADPEGRTERYHSESLLRLPRGFLAYVPPADAPAVAPPPSERSGHITFGSFNNAAKISDAAIALWSRILVALPDARLLLKARQLDDAAVRTDFAQRFAAHGIDVARIELQGWRTEVAAHLAAYADIDIALDTLPYHGTTTTCEALWMGVPVVTLAGRVHAMRVGASLLGHAGLGELVATSEDEYVELALRLAADRPRLAELRSTLRSRLAASPLTDRDGFVRSLEEAYRIAWRRWCARR